jgi:protein ImuB
MCLRLPHWPVQRTLAERPELRAGPLLLLRRDPRRGAVVADGCGRARAAGVRADMPLAEAEGLLPAAVARPADPAADLAALGRLAEHCERFSPKVGWQTLSGVRRQESGVRKRGLVTPDPCLLTPDYLFLDVTGIGRLFGGEHALAEQVVGTCAEIGYTGRAAVAETLGGAWAVAAVDRDVTIIPPGGLLPALRPLSVETLRLPADTISLLARLGVGTIADLMRLPRAGLATRFGPPLLLRLDQAFGTAPELLVPHRPPPAFEAVQELDYPTDRRADLDQVLDDLIDRVTISLRAHGQGAVRVRLEFRCGPDDICRIDVNLYRPTGLVKPLRELVRLHCDRLVLPGPVDRVRLWADQTVPLRPQQEKLFPDPLAAVAEPLAELLERLGSRLSSAAVARPVLRADPLPERAVRYGPPIRRVTRPESPRPVASHRPLRLLTQPAPIVVEAVDGVPVSFRWHGWHAVARCWGPERIETGWWRTGLIRRDYYRVETAAGRRLWLFRELDGSEWFLHGSFA